jgi:hypothetical protein
MRSVIDLVNIIDKTITLNQRWSALVSRGDAAQSEGDGMAMTVDVVEELGSDRFLFLPTTGERLD